MQRRRDPCPPVQSRATWQLSACRRRSRAGTRIPEPLLGAAQPYPDDQDRKLWPLYPVELADDVPFMLATGWNLGGMPEPPSSHVTWAERYGVLRAEPLQPANPLLAAERLIALPKTQRLRRAEYNIQLQAWRMVADLLPPTQPAGDFGTLAAAQWRALRKAASDRNLRGDAAKRAFVADAKN